MTSEQWFWAVLVIMNALCAGANIASMVHDGARRLDYVMLAGAAAVMTLGLMKMADAA